MKRQDELLLVYPGKAPNVRKWILSQLDGLAGAFDAQETFAFLLSQTQEEEALVRNQALFSLQLFLPAFTRARHAAGATAPADPDALRRSALAVAGPLIEAMRGAAGHKERPLRTLARLGLAQFPVAAVQDHVLAEYRRNPHDFELLLAYVRATGAGEMERPLVELMKEHHRQEPDLLLLLAGAPGDAAAAAAAALAGATDVTGRMNLGIALSKVEGGDIKSAAAALLAPGEGWVAVHVLAALEASRDQAAMPLVAQLARHPTELVRIEAVRVAGALGGDGAIEICIEAGRGASPRLMAQALESLAQLGAPAPGVQALALNLLSSPSPSARLAAVLAFADPADRRVEEALAAMFLSAEPHDRLLAAFALGYLQGGSYLKYLMKLAAADPCMPVRGQAAKSLSKYPIAKVQGPLFALLGDADPRIAAAAGLALGRYGSADAKVVGAAAAAALSSARTPGARARLYRLLGQVGARLRDHQYDDLLGAGLADAEPEALCGVLDGIKQAGDTRTAPEMIPRLLKLCEHANPAVGARAASASVLLGGLDAIDVFVRQLKEADEVTLPAWLHHALDVGLALTEALPAGAFPRLAEALSERDRAAQAANPARVASGPFERSGRPGLISRQIPAADKSRVVRAVDFDMPALDRADPDEIARKLNEHLLDLSVSSSNQASAVRRSIGKDAEHLEAVSTRLELGPGAFGARPSVKDLLRPPEPPMPDPGPAAALTSEEAPAAVAHVPAPAVRPPRSGPTPLSPPPPADESLSLTGRRALQPTDSASAASKSIRAPAAPSSPRNKVVAPPEPEIARANWDGFPFKALGGVAAVLALVVTLWIFVPRRSSDDSGLTVAASSGAATAGPDPGGPLPKGILKPGLRLATGPGGKIQLRSLEKSTIDMIEKSELTIATPSDDGDVRVKLQAGRVDCDVKGEQVVLPFGGHAVTGLKGTFSVTIEGPKFRVLSIKGDVLVKLSNGEIVRLKAGEAVALARPPGS